MSITDDVKEYYGKVLKQTADLKTDACCTMKGGMPARLKTALALVHPEVVNRYYGCGLIIPECLEGMSILDLGSGSGQDCYVLSKLVGEKGHVTGIDMTEEQLAVAREYEQYHADKFGYASPNTNFVQGYIEKLDEAGIKSDSYDVIVSNCVVNLSPDKKAVLREAYRVLKVGGELYFGDVYTDSDIPEAARKDKVLWGECISGALKWQELYDIAAEIGFSEPRIKAVSPINIGNKAMLAVVGDAKFASVTFRLFKLPPKLESPSSVVYSGQLEEASEKFQFDFRTEFPCGKPVAVNAQLATILKSSRFAKVFTITDLQLPEPRVNPFELLQKKISTGACETTISIKCCSGGSCTPKAATEVDACCAASSNSAPAANQCPPSSGKCCGSGADASAPKKCC